MEEYVILARLPVKDIRINFFYYIYMKTRRNKIRLHGGNYDDNGLNTVRVIDQPLDNLSDGIVGFFSNLGSKAKDLASNASYTLGNVGSNIENGLGNTFNSVSSASSNATHSLGQSLGLTTGGKRRKHMYGGSSFAEPYESNYLTRSMPSNYSNNDNSYLLGGKTRRRKSKSHRSRKVRKNKKGGKSMKIRKSIKVRKIKRRGRK